MFRKALSSHWPCLNESLTFHLLYVILSRFRKLWNLSDRVCTKTRRANCYQLTFFLPEFFSPHYFVLQVKIDRDHLTCWVIWLHLNGNLWVPTIFSNNSVSNLWVTRLLFLHWSYFPRADNIEILKHYQSFYLTHNLFYHKQICIWYKSFRRFQPKIVILLQL